jgi:hypothetical protein
MNTHELQEAYGFMSSLPCGDASLPPLILDLESQGIMTHENLRYGDISVINATNPTNEANRLLIEVDQGWATIGREGSRQYVVTDERFQGQTVIVRGKISYTEQDGPKEFDGWFVAEEFTSGDYHENPYLLLAPHQVQPKPPREDDF